LKKYRRRWNPRCNDRTIKSSQTKLQVRYS